MADWTCGGMRAFATCSPATKRNIATLAEHGRMRKISRRFPTVWRRGLRIEHLGQQFLHHLRRFDPCELEVEPLMAVGEPLVVVAEQVQYGRVEVADVDGVANDVVGEIIGL